MNNPSQNRFPKLSSFSVALLEHITEPILGSASQEILKAPIVEKELRDTLNRVIVRAEKRFIDGSHDPEIQQAILGLPLSDIPSVKQAVRAYYDHPLDSSLSNILQDRLSRDYPLLEKSRIGSATNEYLRILKEELVIVSRDVREKINALGIQNIQTNTAQIVEILEDIRSKETEPSSGRVNGNPHSMQTPLIATVLEEYAQLVKTNMEFTRDRFPRDPQRNLIDFYIEPMGSTEAPPRNVNEAEEVGTKGVDLWKLMYPSLAKGRSCIVLADFGMGKSWFLQNTHYRLALDLLANTSNTISTWLPLKVNLRGFRYKSPSPLSGDLFRNFGIRGKPASVFNQIKEKAWMEVAGETQFNNLENEFIRLYEEGRFLFLLDALDEIALSSREEVDRILQNLGELSAHSHRSPVILTCRRTFFRNAAQEKSLVDRGFDVYYLWPWSGAQIMQYLDKVYSIGLLQVTPSEVMERIKQTHDLRDLSGRAILSAMLVSQWKQIAHDLEISLPTLYERHVENALLDWQGGKSLQLERHELARYMEEVAFLMFQLNSLSISPSELDEYFAGKFDDLGVKESSLLAESISRDIKTNSLLLREHNNYVFCHSSVWEFLVARKLARSLKARDLPPFQVSNRSQQYRSIFNNFLIPMLKQAGQIQLLFEIISEDEMT